MIKNKVYRVHVCLCQSIAEVKSAFCVCVSGLEGSCNHVAGLMYALENFVRLGLREESKLACTSKLQLWNRPRKQKVPPSKISSVRLVKEEYGKQKKARKQPRYDPRPTNLRLVDPSRIARLQAELQEEHENLLGQDESGMIERYGSSCWLRLLAGDEPSEDESDESAEEDSESDDDDDGDNGDDDGGGDGSQAVAQPESVRTYKTPDDLYKAAVCVTRERRLEIEEMTRGQCNAAWLAERRVRVTSTLTKSVACRRSADFTTVIQNKLASSFKGNAATRYGHQNEKRAIDQFKELTKELGSVRASGLVIDVDMPWLAASPDGLFTDVEGNLHLLEVKCPYRARDCSINEALEKFSNLCISRNSTGSLQLKKSHCYYYQMQIAMHVCRCSHGYLLLRTEKELATISVPIDSPLVEGALSKLKDFYFGHLLPALFANG